VSWNRSALTSCDDFQGPDCRLFDLLCAMLRRVATHKTRPGGGDVAPSVFRHLGEELKRPGASTRGAADAGSAASNKRTLGEIRAARRLSRVMFSPKRRHGLNCLCLFGAACTMRVTSAGQFRVVGKIRRVTFLEAMNLRREAA
jgi:hypothetical protein